MGQTRPQTDREKTQFNKRTQTQNLPHEPENKKPETPLPTIVTKLSATRNQPQCDIQLPGTKHRFFNLLKFVSKKNRLLPSCYMFCLRRLHPSPFLTYPWPFG